MGGIYRTEPQPATRPEVERRVVPRIGVVVGARLRIPALDTAFFGTVLNLSTAGAFIATGESLAAGTEIEIELFAPTALVPLQARGVVVRLGAVSEQPGLGVQFSWLSFEARELVARLQERKNNL
jgi:hypothetical protein